MTIDTLKPQWLFQQVSIRISLDNVHRHATLITMGNRNADSLHNVNEDSALRTIVEGTASETGERFFTALVENLAKALNTHGAWVTEYIEESRRLRMLAYWVDGQFAEDYEYNIAGTPCERVIDSASLRLFSENLIAQFPDDPDLEPFGAISYMGVPLLDIDAKILGHLAVQDIRPMAEEPEKLALIKIFGARAAAELQRLRAESEVREREEKLTRLVDSAMDAIIELDCNLKVTRVNPAAAKVFRCVDGRFIGREFTHFLTDEGLEKLTSLIKELDARPQNQRYLWIPGGLKAVCDDRNEFHAEATLSQFEIQRATFYTLILRNVNERLEAERKIHSLIVEAEYLKEEIKALHNFDEIIANSKPMLRLLQDVEKVAKTDTTVLILGETGTGKELIARALHATSPRSQKPLIKVNCAAIPAALIESEFFGHEKGAFTGATSKRDGRFALADGGTIFLDEVGELPLDLQVKLLRVLQEGEFEPVGSSQTRKVDVRVLAATNRDLGEEVNNRRFREDLYYRLAVFPLKIPPMRERGDDIILLASAFAEQCAQKMGQILEPLSKEIKGQLKAYDWPGNVRELQNVIERAVITSRNGHLNLSRALPETDRNGEGTNAPTKDDSERVMTNQAVQEIERRNIVRALQTTGWRVAGENGAAQLLGVPPSTLSSRIKALGIQRS
jgi:PAS domain S-box-containing protein